MAASTLGRWTIVRVGMNELLDRLGVVSKVTARE